MVKIVDSMMGEGKAQRYTDLVFTKEGYKTIQDLKEDDLIYGEDGKLHTLLYKIPQGIKDVYKVTFSDNTSTVCCDEHLWTYQKPNDKLIGKFRTNTLKEIMQMKLYENTKRGDKNWQIFIPITNPIEFEEKELKINPYLLGLLIGDGGLTSCVGFTNSEKDIIEIIRTILPSDDLILNNKSINTVGGYAVVKKHNDGKSNILKNMLKEYGLYGKLSYEKHIPKDYLYSSVSQRIDLLSGLIDTDGEVDNNNYYYSTTSKQLKDDIIFIVQSLGGTAYCAERNTKYTYKGKKLNGRLSYRIGIKLPQNILAFKSEKHIKVYKQGNTNPNRSIRKIEYIGKEGCCCIKTSNPTSLYLTNDMIVTHNSTWAIQYMNKKQKEGERFVYVTPYLDEVDRVKLECGFEEPEDGKGGKLESFKGLIASNKSIATTHALFKLLDTETLELLSVGYTLVLDEVLDVVQETTMKKGDVDNMVELGILKYEKDEIIMGDEKIVKEKAEEPNEYQMIAINLLRRNLEIMNGDNKVALIWLFPTDLIKVFDDVFILTFMFDGYPMKGYLDNHNIKQKKYSVHCLDPSLPYEDRVYKLKDYIYPNILKLKSLIHIVEKGKINDLGIKGGFTYSWWDKLVKNKTHHDWITLRKNINNFLVSFAPSRSHKRIIWTTFTKARSGLYSVSLNDDNFVANNIRATNEYKDRDIVIYLVDKRYNPVIQNWFKSKNINIDEDLYALGEMIQCIWRSNIREGGEIFIYLPSKRMRELLVKFLDGKTII